MGTISEFLLPQGMSPVMFLGVTKPEVLICDLIFWAPLNGILGSIGTSRLRWEWHRV